MPHDPRFGPDPDALHPVPGHPRVVFVRNLDLPPNVEVGAYTYYDDPGGADAFLRNVLTTSPSRATACASGASARSRAGRGSS